MISKNQLAVSLVMIGRVLMALYFLIPGLMKFFAWDAHIELMTRHGMIFAPFLLASAGVLQIVAAIALIINRQAALFAFLLAGLVLLINFNLHDFWNLEGQEAGHEQQNFIKNLAIFAGLLMLSGWSYLNHKDTD